MYMRAVRPEPSPAVLFPGLESGVSEASRFSCMKYLGVPGVFDYAGLNRNSRSCSCSYCLPPLQERRRSGLHLFAAQYPAHLYPCLRFAAYLAIGLAQNSGPSGSLALTRGAFPSPPSCRFIPAHSTLRTHQSPGEWQDSVLTCLLDFDQAGFTPARLEQEVSVTA